MIRHTALAAAVLLSPAAAQTICTQSTDNLTVAGGSVACVNQAAMVPVDNGYLRRYTPSSGCMSPSGVNIAAVHMGVEIAAGGPNSNGMVPVNVRLYSVDPTAQLTYANMTLIHDEPVMVPDQNNAIFVAPLSTNVFIGAGLDVVVEVFSPTGVTTGDSFFIGSNATGQSRPSYLAATACGANEPTDTATLGFPNMHMILDLEFGTGFGTRYCSPAVNNSTGVPASIAVSGSPLAMDNDLTLSGSDLPNGAFAFFLTSMNQGMVPNPGGSQGILCLGAPIGRYVGPGQIVQSVNGSISLVLNLTQTPTPTGLVAIVGGQTWNFQAWYRDAMGGTATSNFTDAMSVAFQ